jgi:hypothetical protein
MLVIPLHRSERNVPVVLSSQLVRARPCVHAAFTAVEAHASYIVIVDNRSVVNVGDVYTTEVGNGAIVVKRVTTPVAALKTNTTVTVPVVDTTVETYVRTPVALVPEIEAVTPAPITGSPKITRLGRHHPRARYPVIVIITVSPVARCPDVPNSRARGLHIHRQSRGCDSDGNTDGDEREGRHRKCRQREPCDGGSGRIEATRFVVHDDLVALSERQLNAVEPSRFREEIYVTPLQRQLNGSVDGPVKA